jgi:hypothetical protein
LANQLFFYYGNKLKWSAESTIAISGITGIPKTPSEGAAVLPEAGMAEVVP